MQLSVIIPAYNVGKTIQRCLLSLDSALKLANIKYEIIVVDDSSTDDTAKVVRKIAKKKPEVSLIQPTEKVGAGGGRNVGLEQATGEFVWFVDGDDEAYVKNFKRINFEKATEGIDVLMFRYNQVQNRKRLTEYTFNQYDEDVLRTRPSDEFTVLEFPPILSVTHATWTKWVRREFLLENGIDFPPKLIHQDFPWNLKLLCYAKKIRLANIVLYTLYMIDSGISRINDSRKMDTLKVMKIANEWADANIIDADVWANYYIWRSHMMLKSSNMTAHEPTKKAIFDDLVAGFRKIDVDIALKMVESEFLYEDLKKLLMEEKGMNYGVALKILGFFNKLRKFKFIHRSEKT
ncbi:hypothetical protein FACS189425_07290 [Clostridia bacterium]|nr:hypothetical protein FACS189425_07290 [Clostridia bacterium]